MTTYPTPPLQRLPSMLAGHHRQLNVSKQLAVIMKSAVSAATPQPWKPLTLVNDWNSVAGYIAAQYRQFAAGSLEIIGVIGGGGISDGTVVASLPGGMFNTAHAWPFEITVIAGATAAPMDTPLLTAQTNGNLTVSGLPAGTTQISFHEFLPLIG